MDRRRLMGRLVTFGSIALAGCFSGQEPPLGGTQTPKPTDKPTATAGKGETPTPTQANPGTLETRIKNDDDQSHRVHVAVTNQSGNTVEEAFAEALPPGESMEFGGSAPRGRYTITVETNADSATYEWSTDDCTRLHLLGTIGDGGTVSLEQELCQN